MSIAVPSGGPLWSRRDATLLGTLLAVGAVLVGASWFFAAGRADAGDQLVFVSLALLGALIGLAGVAAWTVHGRRLIGARRGLLLGTAPPARAGGTDWAAHAVELVAGPQGKWFHRADCLLADGRGWAASPRAQHESAGRKACPGCRP
ncbi:MAG TPA: hypothetical protein VGQ80_14325 [Acidimicrobiia bacterium]|nr:hypothetical protein [Acidimicrobiia bacterium]